jgi:integral membrane protein (TIGR01906 family)
LKESRLVTKILKGLMTVILPLIILLLSIRFLISPVFPRVEYRLPGFPDDPFGFSLQDRLRWSEPSINYLTNNEEIDYLGDLQFENGEPIFNQRELSHMEDVKAVVTGMRIALAFFMIVLLIGSFVLNRMAGKKALFQAYRQGGWATIGLILAILVFVALSFSELFTWFHQIFFENGTWQFYTSDTLIRLFPMRFWRDAFIFVGIFSLTISVLIIFFSRKHGKKVIV